MPRKSKVYVNETEEEEDLCPKCNVQRMASDPSKQDRNGLRTIKWKCMVCKDTGAYKFYAHFGCANYPNCDIAGCGSY